MDDDTDQTGMVDYAWDHAVISDRVYHDVKKSCNFSEENVTKACDDALEEYFAVYDIIDMYSLYAPVCVRPNTSMSWSERSYFVEGASPKLFSKYVSSMINPTSHITTKTVNLMGVFAAERMASETGRLWSLCLALQRGVL